MRKTVLSMIVLGLLLGSVAIAVASESDETPPVETTETVEVPEVVPLEDGASESDEGSEVKAEGDGEENHGHCVSWWAHESKAQGLVKRWRGAFVAAVAEDPEAQAPKAEPGDACDYQEELDAALLEQEAELAALEAARAAKVAAREAKKAERQASKPAKGKKSA